MHAWYIHDHLRSLSMTYALALRRALAAGLSIVAIAMTQEGRAQTLQGPVGTATITPTINAFVATAKKAANAIATVADPDCKTDPADRFEEPFRFTEAS